MALTPLPSRGDAHPSRSDASHPSRSDASHPSRSDASHPSRSDEDTLWAVVATVGKTDRVAEVFRSREAALADRAWRAREVLAYADFLRRARQPVPHYSVTPIRRSDLPRKWTPLPALGFLRGHLA